MVPRYPQVLRFVAYSTVCSCSVRTRFVTNPSPSVSKVNVVTSPPAAGGTWTPAGTDSAPACVSCVFMNAVSVQVSPRSSSTRRVYSTYSLVKSPPGVFVYFHDPNRVDMPDAGARWLVSVHVVRTPRGVYSVSTVDFGTRRSVSRSTELFHVPSSLCSEVYRVMTPSAYSTPVFGSGAKALAVRSTSFALYWSR